MKNAVSIFRFLTDCASRGERTALVTVTDVIGSSSRAPGTHMAISESGAYVGSLSGGCVEAAVVGEAVRVIANGQTELIRFGAGSRLIDIRLPCGGGLDLLIVPQPCPTVVGAVLARLERRDHAVLEIGRDGSLRLLNKGELSMRRRGFVAYHRPNLRIFVIGHGAETPALTRVALAFGAEVTVLTPDAEIRADMEAIGATSRLLRTPGRCADLSTDSDSAVVFLFHDHDWEATLLDQALEQQAFFIGAMGSRRTQRRRLEIMRSRGLSEAHLSRIEGPIGLIPATRDPQTLAISVLAQLADRHRAHCLAECSRHDQPAADHRQCA